MNFKRFLPGLIIGSAILMMTMTTQAQQVEPGVGLRGLLEVGRLHIPQIKAFTQRYNASPSHYGIEVKHNEGVITEIMFRDSKFSTKIRGFRIRVEQAWSVENTDRIGGLRDSNLGVELIENNGHIEAIVVFPPLR
jgi:hypothetical protein